MEVPDGYNGPIGSQGTLVVELTPPRNAFKSLQTCQDHSCPYASQVGVVQDRSVFAITHSHHPPTHINLLT